MTVMLVEALSLQSLHELKLRAMSNVYLLVVLYSRRVNKNSERKNNSRGIYFVSYKKNQAKPTSIVSVAKC